MIVTRHRALRGYTDRVNDDLNTRRGKLSLAVLLGLVVAVTLQLVTGFALQFGAGGGALLTAHVAGGIAATLLVTAEWLWLLATPAGRARLAAFVSRESGLAQWSDGAFLLAVSATVVLGLLLASNLRGGPALFPFDPLLATHRGLAIAVAFLYLLHSATVMRRRHPRHLV